MDSPAPDDQPLDRLIRLSERADPPPWTSLVEGRDHESGDTFIMVGTEGDRREDLYLSRDSGPADGATHDLVAEARNALPGLIAEVRRLRSGFSRSGIRAQLARVQGHPGMYLARSTFPEACALVVGYDMALDDQSRFLDGFRKWLVVRRPERPELAFSSLVLQEAIGRSTHESLSEEENTRAVASLFTLLDDYLDDTDR